MKLFFIFAVFWFVYLIFPKKTDTDTKKQRNSSVDEKDSLSDFQIKSSLQETRRETAQSSPKIIDDDNDLATFTISYGHEEEKSKNKTLGRWANSDETVTINGHDINQGNFYFGGQLKAHSSESDCFWSQYTEASLVDDSLKIISEHFSFEDQSLGYWPKFISLSPRGRGAYLDWLASGRSDASTPIGYVFIYFYGLERRVLVDAMKGKVPDSEYVDILKELKRLCKIFGDNRSFRSYSSHLIELMVLIRPDIVSISEQEFLTNDSLLFKYRLATTVDEGYPISADLALSWIKFYPEYNFRMPARRCDVEFAQLFMLRYTEKFGDGILIKPNKAKLKLEYRPASSTIRDVEIEQKDLSDPSMLKTPVKKLISIADICTNDLDAYSRYLGKKDTSKEDVAAVLLLPDELTNANSSSVIAKFKNWADEQIENKSKLVRVSDFWSHTKTPLPEKINKKETELIHKLAQKAGYGVAPDARYHYEKLTSEGNLVLFEEGHGEFFEPSSAFNEVGMTLRLGAMVAQIDLILDDSELIVLHQLIDHDTKLSPTEKRSLHAYLTWRLNTPANMTGLKTRLEKLGEKEKTAISHILIGVALADGKIDPVEIKQLEKLYTALGLDKSLVTNDIHGLSSSKVAIEKSSNKGKSGFSLDENVLALHESETKDVQSMLGAIFIDDELEQVSSPLASPSTVVDDGLDASHSELYQNLIAKEKWTRQEVAELCDKLGLMVDGALEAINDWSFEMIDAPVIDDDGDIYVDFEIVEELQG